VGKYWLTSLPQVLRDAGLVVDTYAGWEVRARSTGGYDGVFAVQVHHTASQTSPQSDMDYMWNGSPDRPVGAIYLARDGRVTVGAAGATNTSGKGGPRQTAHGTIPLDSANKYVISIEAANNGVGEVWPAAQQDAYIKLCSALQRAYGLSVGDTHAHFEWTDRKIDPAGNSRYAAGGNKWNMDAFRGDIWLYDQDHDPTPSPPPSEEDDDMRLFATTDFHGSVWVGNGIHRRTVNDEAELEEMIYRGWHDGGPRIFVACSDAPQVTDKGQIYGCKMSDAQLEQLGVVVTDDRVAD
jgi:hypothetical protein